MALDGFVGNFYEYGTDDIDLDTDDIDSIDLDTDDIDLETARRHLAALHIQLQWRKYLSQRWTTAMVRCPILLLDLLYR